MTAAGRENAAAQEAARANAIRKRQFLLGRAVSEELGKRVRMAFLVAIGLGLLSVFALGGSFLGDAIKYSLLLSYAVFLAVFAVILLLGLLRATGGQLGRAIVVGETARALTEAEWRRATGSGIPRDERAARDWLAANPETDANRPQRLSAQVRSLDLAAARDTLTRYPRETPFERYYAAADEWFLDYLEGGQPEPTAAEDATAEIVEPGMKEHAQVGLATLRAHLAAARGLDWMSALAAPADFVDTRPADGLRAKLIVVNWTLLMAIAAALIGVALLVGRTTGIFR
jgi:hypothetical protein